MGLTSWQQLLLLLAILATTSALAALEVLDGAFAGGVILLVVGYVTGAKVGEVTGRSPLPKIRARATEDG